MATLRKRAKDREALAVRAATRLRLLQQLSEMSITLAGDPAVVFERVVRMLGELFDVRVVCLSEIVDRELWFRAVYVDGRVLTDAGHCPLSVTPCATVEEGRDLRVYDRVMERFPEASFLRDHNAYAYCGFPAVDNEGRVVAVTCLLDDKPHEFTDEEQQILRVAGQRIATEIERARIITERTLAQEAVKAGEARLASLIATAMDAIVSTDESQTIIVFNQAAEDMFGYKASEMIGAPIVRLIPERFRDAHAGHMDAFGRSPGGARNMGLRGPVSGLRANGTEFPIEASISQTVILGKKLFTVILRDITERKRAEDKIAASERQLREILDALFGFVGLYTVDGILIDANRAPLELAGLTRDEVLGKPFWDTYWWNYDPRVQAELRDAMARAATGEIVRYEPTVRMKGGRLIDIDCTFSPLRDADGSIAGIVGFAVDITERKRALHVLQENERQLADAQRLAKLGSWELDLVTNYLHWSDEIYRIFEIDPAQFGASYEAFLATVHPDDSALVNETYQRSVRDRTAYAVEHRLRMPDGRVKHVIERGQTTYADAGAPLRSTGTVQDITDRKLAEQRIADSLREKETLLREMHHRVKNNLQIISSLLHFQGKKVKDPDALAVLDEGRDRLRSMILVHEKLYGSGDLVNVDFGDYVRTLVNQLRESHAGSRTDKVQVDIHVESVFLPIETALPCGMILSELTANSFKHAFADRPRGRLRIEATRTDRSLSLVVEDDGIGLPDVAFDDSPESFGLQLVRNLAVQLGATVSVGRRPGARIRVTVPLRESGAGGE